MAVQCDCAGSIANRGGVRRVAPPNPDGIAMRTLYAALTLVPLFFTFTPPTFSQVPAKFGAKPTLLTIPETYRGFSIELRTWLQTPGGSGPYNTVMLIPGCNGVDRHGWAQMQTWAQWLVGLNYATLIIDSLTPRGISNVCGDGRGNIVPGDLHAADFYTAAAYLSHLPQLQGGKFGGMGFSHGGWGILEAASDHSPNITDLRARFASQHVEIAALVALYPACFRDLTANFQVPLLILIGDDDYRTPAAACERLAAYPRQGGAEVILKVYPGATHVFDVDKPPRMYLGHEIRYDSAATADARERVKQFFAHWLQ